MASAFNVGSLSNYTKTNEDTLILKSFFEAKTASRMQVMTGVKTTEQIPSMQDTLVMQDGSSCGFSASGDTTINARVLTVGKIKINKEWCVNDLETKYTALLLSPGSNYDALPGKIDQAFAELISGSIGETNEKGIWQGDTTSWDVNLNKYDGLVKIINAASGPVQANATAFYGTPATAFTAANIIAIVQSVVAAMPLAMNGKPDFKINMPTNLYKLYQLAVTNANLYHFTAAEQAMGEMKVIGTDVTMVSVPGLNGVNAIYALRDSNMFLGVDLEHDYEEFKFWYSQDFDLVRFACKYKYGVQISQLTEIVKFTL